MGNAIANANVKVTVNGKTSSVNTDSNCRASLDLDLPAGTYDVLSQYEDASATFKGTVKSTLTVNGETGTYLNSKVSAKFLDTAINIIFESNFKKIPTF